MTKIERDAVRIDTYQELKNNLAAVEEFFRHGDILVKRVNKQLREVRQNIDEALKPTFTAEDFNSMLVSRNDVLAPIFQNASFAVVFTPYGEVPVDEPEIPVIPATPVTMCTNRISNGILNGTIITTTLEDKVIKVVDISYNKGVLEINNTTEYLADSTVSTHIKYSGGIKTNHVVTTVVDNTVNSVISNITDGVVVSNTYLTYIDGVLTANTTTLV